VDGVRRYFVVGDEVQTASLAGLPAALAAKASNPSSTGPALNLVWEYGEILAHLLGHGISQDDLERTALSIS
jgi:hypothetical protein